MIYVDGRRVHHATPTLGRTGVGVAGRTRATVSPSLCMVVAFFRRTSLYVYVFTSHVCVFTHTYIYVCTSRPSPTYFSANMSNFRTKTSFPLADDLNALDVVLDMNAWKIQHVYRTARF